MMWPNKASHWRGKSNMINCQVRTCTVLQDCVDETMFDVLSLVKLVVSH